MTADALTQEIIKLAAERRIDPYWSLLSIIAAGNLASLTHPHDLVLWPDDQGGLAWEVLARSEKSVAPPKSTGSAADAKTKNPKIPAATTSRESMQSGRIICVRMYDRPHADSLWNRLESASAAAGREVLVYRLVTGSPPGKRVSTGENPVSLLSAGETRPRYPSWVTLLLGRIFPQTAPEQACQVEVLPASEPERDNRELFILHPSAAAVRGTVKLSAGGLSDTWTSWLDGRPDVFPIPSYVEIRERFVLASASSAAGFLPLISLAPGEGPEASILAQRMLLEKKRIIIRTADDPEAVDSFQVNTTISLLTPASESDLKGALSIVGKSGGDGESALIVEAGRTAIPEKPFLKTSWEETGALVVREIAGGTAGSILIAAPGHHAAEAVKAAVKLSRENFSVTVLSLRYLRPSQTDQILKAAENFDLVMLSDSGEGNPAVFSAEAMRLVAGGRDSVIISRPPGNARTMTDNAIAALREHRFRRTVDDVRKDRWR